MTLLACARKNRASLWRARSATRSRAGPPHPQLTTTVAPMTTTTSTAPVRPSPSPSLLAATTATLLSTGGPASTTGHNKVVGPLVGATKPDPTAPHIPIVSGSGSKSPVPTAMATATLRPPSATSSSPLAIPTAAAAIAGHNNSSGSSSSSASASPPTSSSSPWQALFLPFFAMLSPEKYKESTLQAAHAVGDSDLDLLCVPSVPPQLSDVIEDVPGAYVWRYDMDSYAANRHNEDRAQCIVDAVETADHPEATPLVFCGCYDGHGGEAAVAFVERHLYPNIKRRLVALGHIEDGNNAAVDDDDDVDGGAKGEKPLVRRSSSEGIIEAIIQGFLETDEEFHRQSQRQFAKGQWSACSVGACAVIALVVDGRLFVASCGDCRAIMAFREPNGSLSVEQITWDHSANDEREQERLRMLYPEDYDIVREIGARNFYVKGRLQPTRSLGDTYMKISDVNRAPMPRGLRIRGSFTRPYITAIPDVFEFDLSTAEGQRRPEFLVLGSDGLYGELTNDEIVEMVDRFRRDGEKNVSEALRLEVMTRIAEYFGFSVDELEDIEPGERRNYHDDITIDVLHFTPPTTANMSTTTNTTDSTPTDDLPSVMVA